LAGLEVLEEVRLPDDSGDWDEEAGEDEGDEGEFFQCHWL
jgi:hypothetical protein